jgi:hypothetical protein
MALYIFPCQMATVACCGALAVPFFRVLRTVFTPFYPELPIRGRRRSYQAFTLESYTALYGVVHRES